MTEIENLEDKMILFKKVVNNNNLKTTKSLTSNFTPIYHSILSNKTFTFSTHLAESDKLLAFFESFV